MTDLPIGISTFVWHSPMTDELLEPRLRQLADWGFDAVELPLEQPGDWDPGQAGELLAELGLTSVIGAVFGPGRELTAAADEVVTGTKEYVRAVIDAAQRQGSPLVVGPMYTSVGRTWRADADERRAFIAQLRRNLAELADYAGEHGVRLAIEPLNRYETSVLTTAQQVMDVVGDLPAEAIGVNLDTYHMNIEESSFDEAFGVVGDRLLHLQVCANDRGAPGNDHLDWDTIRTAVARCGYRGMLSIESFTADNATIATAASIWRPLASSQDALAVGGLEFLQKWRDGWPVASDV